MEAMSRVPYNLPQAARSPGLRLGAKNKDARLVDGLVHDGLWDVYNDQHMGVCGDMCARTYGISREEQDDYTLESYRRAQQAWDAGHFDGEVVPLDVGDGTTVVRDDEVGNVRPDKLRKLRAVFTDPGGTVTAANSSKISDGAAAMVLMSGKRARECGLVPLFRHRGFADAARAPVEFTVAPADAVRLAVQRAGVTLADVAYHEINEAFAVVPLVNVRLLGLDLARVNVHGGAVALGHPIGCSGARIVGTLYSVLKHRDAAIGCASICNGGGGASAVVIERLS
jgi:acetyl-CoA C-acetyltransferase